MPSLPAGGRCWSASRPSQPGRRSTRRRSSTVRRSSAAPITARCGPTSPSRSSADLDLEKKINLDDLISHTYRFDEINEGFALMLAGEGARGVIVFDWEKAAPA